jgi:TPR repeat protein
MENDTDRRTDYEEAGIGCRRDIEEAKRWYMRAAAQGNKRAMQRLTELKKQGAQRVNSKKPTRQDAKVRVARSSSCRLISYAMHRTSVLSPEEA